MDSTLAQWRADTPGCATRIHLNNAGAGLMPASVVKEITDHIMLEAAAGGYEAAELRKVEIEQVYQSIAKLVGGAQRNMAIVANATTGFIQSVSSFDFSPGDAIVTTRSDYTSYQIQWLAMARRLNIRILHAEDLPSGGVDPDSVRRLLADPGVRLVHVSWIPTHSGLIQDVAAVGQICEERGIPYLVDACQAIGQIPIDVNQLHCDYLSVTARKFLRGPRGIGFLYVSDRALARGDHPLFVDMRGAQWTAPDAYTLADTAKRHEDWEFPYALVLGLGEAARYALRVGVPEAGRRAREHATNLRQALERLPNVRVLDKGKELSAIVTATVEKWSGPDLVTEMARHRINTSATLRWFGLLDLTPKGVESAIRISPHYYNTAQEVSAAVDVIAALR